MLFLIGLILGWNLGWILRWILGWIFKCYENIQKSVRRGPKKQWMPGSKNQSENRKSSVVSFEDPPRIKGRINFKIHLKNKFQSSFRIRFKSRPRTRPKRCNEIHVRSPGWQCLS